MPIENFHERVLAYAQFLYERSLFHLERDHFKKAEAAVMFATSAAAFAGGDDEADDGVRKNARNLRAACEALLSEIWAAQIEGYGRHFMSGAKTKEQRLVSECVADLDDAMRKVNRLNK